MKVKGLLKSSIYRFFLKTLCKHTITGILAVVALGPDKGIEWKPEKPLNHEVV